MTSTLTPASRILFTSSDWDGSNSESHETTIQDWLDANDPENEEVRDACITLMSGFETRVEMGDQASRYVVEVIA